MNSVCVSVEKRTELYAGNAFGPNLEKRRQSDCCREGWLKISTNKMTKLGKLCMYDPHISLCSSILFPLLRECPASLSSDLHRRKELLHSKSSCQDNHIEICLDSVGANDTSLIDGLDSLGDHLEVFGLKAFKTVGIKYTALTTCSSSASHRHTEGQRGSRLAHQEESLEPSPCGILSELSNRCIALHDLRL